MDLDHTLDSPSSAFGILSPDGQKQTLLQEDRWPQFVHLTSSYYMHGDLSTRNVANLEFKHPDLNRKSVVASLSPQEISFLTDTEVADRSDIFFLAYRTVLFNQMRKALFNSEIQSLWPKLDMWLLYCDSSAGSMTYAAWEIEKITKTNSSYPVQILTIEDAHHLVSNSLWISKSRTDVQE